MRILLTDINETLVREWEKIVPDGVSCVLRDIFSNPVDALVSPANSFGFMDGGIDMVYSRRFGWKVQERLQSAIQQGFGGELLVGQAFNVPTDDPDFPIVIAAPTMRVPMRIVDFIAVRLSTRAAVRLALSLRLHAIAMPGMGAFSGRVPPRDCAVQMMRGIDDALHPKPFPRSWVEAHDDHFRPY